LLQPSWWLEPELNLPFNSLGASPHTLRIDPTPGSGRQLQDDSAAFFGVCDAQSGAPNSTTALEIGICRKAVAKRGWSEGVICRVGASEGIGTGCSALLVATVGKVHLLELDENAFVVSRMDADACVGHGRC
jgi:hypothetical protein